MDTLDEVGNKGRETPIVVPPADGVNERTQSRHLVWREPPSDVKLRLKWVALVIPYV